MGGGHGMCGRNRPICVCFLYVLISANESARFRVGGRLSSHRWHRDRLCNFQEWCPFFALLDLNKVYRVLENGKIAKVGST